MENYHLSVTDLWQRFKKFYPEYSDKKYTAWYFCDTEKCANELADLVCKGIKRATASLYYWYETGKEILPEKEGISVITDWDGIAQCIIKTKKVTILPFKNVNSEMAFTEGEGDKSLDYWRNAHISFFGRESAEENIEFSEDTMIVFEEFEMIYK